MSVETYFAIALVSLEADAMVSFATKKRFKPFAAAGLSLLWPITCWLTILGVVKLQKGGDR